MKMTARLFLMTLLIAIRLGATIESLPGPIEYRFNQAAVVCRGITMSTSRSPAQIYTNGTLSRASYNVVVSIERLYKGPTGLRELTVALPADDQMSSSPSVLGEYYLLFLRPETRSLYALIDSAGAQVPLGREALSFPFRFSGVRALEEDVAGTVDEPRRTRKALEELAQFSRLSPDTIRRLESLRTNRRDVSMLRLTLLARSDPARYLSNLADALEAWGEPLPPAFVTVRGILEDLTTSKDLPQLERLATIKNSNVRLDAMDGIRHIKDPAAIPFLIKQLDYPNDTMTEYLAVITLAEIVHKYGEFGPGMGPFERNPAKYIALWKQWWHDQGNP